MIPAFDGPTQIWLEKKSAERVPLDVHGKAIVLHPPILRCACGRGMRGTASDLADSCPRNRINGALPCPMADLGAVTHESEAERAA